MNLGENIYKFRTQKNMSQGDLADALNVSRQSVSKWENNAAVPDLDKLVKMSDLFGVALDELVGRASSRTDFPSDTFPKTITIREIIGVLLLCTAVAVLIIFSIRANLGLSGGIYYGLILGSAGAALCWPQILKVHLCFGTVDAVYLLARFIRRPSLQYVFILAVPFMVIYIVWFFLTHKE